MQTPQLLLSSSRFLSHSQLVAHAAVAWAGLAEGMSEASWLGRRRRELISRHWRRSQVESTYNQVHFGNGCKLRGDPVVLDVGGNKWMHGLNGNAVSLPLQAQLGVEELRLRLLHHRAAQAVQAAQGNIDQESNWLEHLFHTPTQGAAGEHRSGVTRHVAHIPPFPIITTQVGNQRCGLPRGRKWISKKAGEHCCICGVHRPCKARGFVGSNSNKRVCVFSAPKNQLPPG